MTSLVDLHPDASFDLAFIDADKQSNVEYFLHAKRLVRSGGVIIVDNVVRNGRVADPEQSDPSIEGVRRLLEFIQKDPSVESTTLGTVGEKGYDGFLYAINKPSTFIYQHSSNTSSSEKASHTSKVIHVKNRKSNFIPCRDTRQTCAQ